MYGSFPVY